MTSEDVPAAEQVSDEGFYELDTRLQRASDPAPQRRSERHREVWIERTRHLVGTDPGGCWVAEDETGLVGMVTSFRRETLWCLATYAVLPDRQGQGIGKPLLAAALDHGRACTRGMLSASSDAKAVRMQSYWERAADYRDGRYILQQFVPIGRLVDPAFVRRVPQSSGVR